MVLVFFYIISNQLLLHFDLYICLSFTTYVVITTNLMIQILPTPSIIGRKVLPKSNCLKISIHFLSKLAYQFTSIQYVVCIRPHHFRLAFQYNYIYNYPPSINSSQHVNINESIFNIIHFIIFQKYKSTSYHSDNQSQIKISEMKILILLLLLRATLSRFNTFSSVIVEKQIVRSITIDSEQSFAILTSDEDDYYFQFFDLEGKNLQIKNLNLTGSMIFRQMYWHKQMQSFYLLFQTSDNQIQELLYSNQFEQVNQTTFNLSISSSAFRKNGSLAYLSFCQEHIWKQYRIDSNIWLQINSITSINEIFTSIKYTSDGTIVCLMGQNQILLTQWTIVCYSLINDLQKILQYQLNATTLEIQLIEESHKMLISINKSVLYGGSIQTALFTQLTFDGFSIVTINSINTFSDANQNQLISIVGKDSQNKQCIIVVNCQNRTVSLLQKIYISSRMQQQFQVEIFLNDYIFGYYNNRVFIIFNKDYSIGVWAIILLVSFILLLAIIILLTYKKQKYIFLKNLKIYYRTNKIIHVAFAFIMSCFSLWLMLLLFKGEKFNRQISISYFMQYFLLILVITIHQSKTQYDELNKDLKIYRLQGISIQSYLFQRITYLLLLALLLSLLNTFVISFFKNDVISMETLDDYIVIIYAFLLCSLSNLTFCLMITHFISSFYVLIQLLFFYHFLSLFSAGLVLIENDILNYYLYLSGIFDYYYIFNSQLNRVIIINNSTLPKQIGYGFIFSALQILVYLTIYILILCIKYRNSNHLKRDSIRQSIAISNNLINKTSESDCQNIILEVRRLTKKKDKYKILNQINFEIYSQQIFVIYGQNQTGKTTLINMLLSLENIDSGFIVFKEKIKIQCCLQSYSCFDDLTFVEHIQFLCQIKNIKKSKIPQIIVELTDDFYFMNDANKRASQLSGGSRKKLCLALTFIGYPDLLILDEPSFGLDVKFKKIFWQMLKRKKKNNKLTVIVTTANREEAELLGDHIFLIKQNETIFQHGNHLQYSIIFHLENERLFKKMVKILDEENKRYKVNQKNQIIMSISRQKLIQSQFINFLLFDDELGLKYQITNKVEENYYFDEDELSTLLINSCEEHTTAHYLKSQIKGLIIRRLNLSLNYLSITFFAIMTEIIALNLRQIISESTMTIFFLLITFFIYFENGIIRFEEISRKRYLNAEIFGMNKYIYWIFSMLPDVVLLFLIIEGVYLINQLILYFIFGTYVFDWILVLFLIAYSMLYVGITYFFTTLITNYLSYLFFFFFFNGFSFFFLIHLNYKDLYFTQILKYTYFSITFFYINIDPQDYQLVFQVFLQIFFWYSLFLIYLSCHQKQGDQKNIALLSNEQFLPSEDQKQQQYAIQDIQDESQVPLVGDYIYHSYSKQSYIVKNFSILLRKGEIFSLIGGNGAGKTTIFNILTGIINPSSGIIKYFGKNLRQMPFNYHIRVGYCPQFDYLNDVLTVEQNISYFGKIKGMSNFQIKEFTRKYLIYFQIYDQLKVKVCKLSGGNRRKVSSIIAFIGNPTLLFLDQPDSGMDKRSKIKLWNLLSAYCKRNGASAILTTHYTCQIQKYCNRMGILKNGRLISIGSPSELINKYSSKYTLIVRYKFQVQIKSIRKSIQKDQQFYKFNHYPADYKIIYHFEMTQTNFNLILKRSIEQLLSKDKIRSFQFYYQNLQDIIQYIENVSSEILNF